jgi:hypothetical protein
VWPGPKVSAPSPCCPALAYPAAATRPQRRPAPLVSLTRVASPAPRRPPCSATHLHRARELPPMTDAQDPPATALAPPPLTSFSRLHTHVPTPTPFFSSLGPHHRTDCFQNTVDCRLVPISPHPLSSTPDTPEPRAAFPGQGPRSSPEHRGPISRRNLAAAAALLPSLGAPPFELLLSQSTALAHLPLFL